MVEKYKRWLLLILLLVFYSNLYSQIQGKIEYTISINTDNKKEIPRTDENEQAIKILKSARDIIAYLNFTEKESLFEVTTEVCVVDPPKPGEKLLPVSSV